MDLKVFPPRELYAVLCALRNIALDDDRFTPNERALIEGVARIHDAELTADDLYPISFEHVARIVTDPHRRKRAIELAIVVALVEGPPSPETHEAVQAFATALELELGELEVLYNIANGHALMARVDMFRRFTGFIRGLRDFPGVLSFALPMLGLSGNEATAARYHALAHCEPGTLGRTFHDFIRQNDFKFPGEPGGLPLIFHDLGHVLSGYGTDPQGEIQQAAFQAGFVRQNGFTFLLFGILQFHIGLRITPIAKGYEGLFDVPRVLEALRRGAECRVDLTEGYDLFAQKDRPLEDVRRELGVPPLAPEFAKAS
jgi:tellurite resistance protein